MRQRGFMNLILMGVLTLALFMPSWAQGITFDRIVVFGGSVSDSGNVFALNGHVANKPPYNQSDLLDPLTLVPSAPYDVGGHHFSNGATWIEQFARPLGLGESVRPAFATPGVEGTNYAVGGARAADSPGTVNMPEQVGAFLKDFNGVAPVDALYVIDFGGNDVRDALSAPDPQAVIKAALDSLSTNVEALYTAGARKFLIVNVADIGKIPSVLILNAFFPGIADWATYLSGLFNAGLDSFFGNLQAQHNDVVTAEIDVFKTVDILVTNGKPFGLTNVTGACVKPNVPPFTCQTPDEFLFWDGIHPTKTVHAIFAQEATDALK